MVLFGEEQLEGRLPVLHKDDGGVGQEEAAAPQLPVTVFALRHAETVESTKTARDPELSHDGKVRAARLATLLGKAGVTHLYSSPYIRTKATLAPLAEALNLKVVKLDEVGEFIQVSGSASTVDPEED